MIQLDPARSGQRSPSALYLRRGIGFLSLIFPIVLVLGKILLDGGGVLGSLSSYYYSSMRDYFVGTMCSLAVLLVLYRYRPEDDRLGDAVAVFAVGVALFPSSPAGGHGSGQGIIRDVHFACAALFFLSMAYFCLALFTRTDPGATPTPPKKQRNVVYRVCGFVIVACLVLIVATNFAFTDKLKSQVHPLLWLEIVATWAFSVSWLVKGQLLVLGDEPDDRHRSGSP
jgi:hypothetical protein